MKKANEKEMYDVFISYRREDGWESAKHLRDVLVAKGYSVFFDIDSLKNGNFNDAILDYIRNCKDFIIILSPRCLNRCVNEGDWVRKELACALDNKKNIIPVMYENFSFPNDLPKDIEKIKHINGIKVYIEVFDAIVARIISFMNSTPKPWRKKKIIAIVCAVLAVAAVAAAVAFMVWGKPGGSDPGKLTAATQAPVSTLAPVITDAPTATPSPEPTAVPTEEPTAAPTAAPTATATPSPEPTQAPTAEPTRVPTEIPTQAPTAPAEEQQSTTVIGDESASDATEAPADSSYPQNQHSWGNYVPKGTVTVTMKDGTVYTGVANSFLLMSKRMNWRSSGNEGFFEGIDTPDFENKYELENMKLFLEIASIRNRNGVFVTVDDENATNEYILPDEAQFWFIGTKTVYTPEKVNAADVDSIVFDRTRTPDMAGLPFCTVYLEEGCFRSPAAFVGITYNVGGSFPSMRIAQEFTHFSSYPTKIKSIASLEVTKQGADGNMFAAPVGMELRATLKDGETVDFSMSGYFSIFAMSQYGRMRSMSRSSLLAIVFDDVEPAERVRETAAPTPAEAADINPYGAYETAAGLALDALEESLAQYSRCIYVYKDFGDSENHFTQRMLMSGKDASLVHPMDDHWQQNPHSGDSCIRCEIVTKPEDWGGWLFVNGYLPEGSSEPRINNADAPNQGMNLTGASVLRFWARGEKGGEMVEFLVGGYQYGSDAAYPDSCETQRTEYIELDKEWTEYAIDLDGVDTSYLILGFGFSMTGNEPSTGTDESGTADNVFYLDDIRFEGYFEDVHPLIRSYESENVYLKNTAFSYDNALVSMAFISADRQEEAKKILDSFVYAIQHDRYRSGRVRNAYVVGDITSIPGWGSSARLPVCYNAETGTWEEHQHHTGSETGNTAYVALALLQYHARYGGDSYLQAAKELMDWVLDTCGASAPGFTAGYDGWPESGNDAVYPLTYKSIEHNIDAYAAFKRLAEVTGEKKYQNAAESALHLIESLYDSESGVFHTGTESDGKTISKENTVLDAQVWACLALEDEFWPYEDALETVGRMKVKKGGYPFCQSNINGGWWAEGTAFTGLMYRLRGEDEKALEALDALCSIQNDSGLFPAATVKNLSTGIYLFDGTPWEYGNELHIAPTAWFIMAVNAFNPYCFE